MFGLSKNTDGDKPENGATRLSPCEAIASMILNLTYDQMVTMAQEIESRYNDQQGMTLAAVMNQWAKEKRGLAVPRSAAAPAIKETVAATSPASGVDPELEEMRAKALAPHKTATGG